VAHDPTSPFARAAADAWGFGRALAAYARRHDLDDAALAALLGCPVDILTPLVRNVRYLGGAAAAGVAERYGIDAEVLRAVVQEQEAAEAEEGRARESGTRAAAWAWFLDFAGRVPELRACPRGMAYLRQCAAADSRPPRPTGAWFRRLPRHRGQDFIEVARRAVEDRRPADVLYGLAEHRYAPLACALGTARPLPDAVRAWRDGTVPGLAAAVVSGGTLPGVLADALLDAGCDDDELVTHLRQGGGHPPWCWALSSAAAPARGTTDRAPDVAGTTGRATSGAPQLRGVRFGRVERSVLLDLLMGHWPEPEETTRAAREAHRRAFRRLAELGLVLVDGGHPRLTDLGRAVVNAHGQSLAEGKRIRWQQE
jgi:hypothetical protein